jgi:hypothetical protein
VLRLTRLLRRTRDQPVSLRVTLGRPAFELRCEGADLPPERAIRTGRPLQDLHGFPGLDLAEQGVLLSGFAA